LFLRSVGPTAGRRDRSRPPAAVLRGRGAKVSPSLFAVIESSRMTVIGQSYLRRIHPFQRDPYSATSVDWTCCGPRRKARRVWPWACLKRGQPAQSHRWVGCL